MWWPLWFIRSRQNAHHDHHLQATTERLRTVEPFHAQAPMMSVNALEILTNCEAPKYIYIYIRHKFLSCFTVHMSKGFTLSAVTGTLCEWTFLRHAADPVGKVLVQGFLFWQTHGGKCFKFCFCFSFWSICARKTQYQVGTSVSKKQALDWTLSSLTCNIHFDHPPSETTTSPAGRARNLGDQPGFGFTGHLCP